MWTTLSNLSNRVSEKILNSKFEKKTINGYKNNEIANVLEVHDSQFVIYYIYILAI